MARLVMLIDTEKCTGCQTCALVCKMENNLPDGVLWNQVFSGDVADFTGDRSTFTKGLIPKDFHLVTDIAQGSLTNTGGIVNSPNGKSITMNFYTKACQHCSEPPCETVCPTGAIYVNPENGVVDTDFSKCIGCDNCINECPYDVRHHNTNEKWQTEAPGSELTDVKHSEWKSEIGGQGINKHTEGVVDKCTFCSHRLANDLHPLCVESCIAGARAIGYLDPSSEVTQTLMKREYKQFLPEAGTKPSIYFLYGHK